MLPQRHSPGVRHAGKAANFLKMADEIRPIVLFIVESGLAKLRKRVFGPRSLDFEVRGPLRFESGLGFILPIPLCLIWSGGRGPLETVCVGIGGPPLARPPSLIAPCGDLGWGEATSLRARVGGSRHTAAHYRPRTVSWCTIGRGCENSTSSPGTYSAHVGWIPKFPRNCARRHRGA